MTDTKSSEARLPGWTEKSRSGGRFRGEAPGTTRAGSREMNALAWLALVLIVIWLVAVVALKVVSLAIHLALLAAVLLLVAWALRRGKGPVSS